MLVAGFCLAVPCKARAEFEDGWRLARQELNAGRREEAFAAFLALSQSAENDWQQADALEQAVMIAQRLGRVDEAMELADRIPLVPRANAVRMRLMSAGRDWSGILERFGATDFSTWPDSIAAEAYHLRGVASARRRNPEAALPDLKAALERGGVSPMMYTVLAETASELGMDVLAMDVWRDAQRVLGGNRHNAIFYSTVIGRAAILRRHDMHEPALAEFSKLDFERLADIWLLRMLRARAVSFAALDRREEAVADSRRALAIGRISQAERQAFEKIIADMEER